MSEQVSKSEHVVALAKELLDDIELGRLPTEQLLRKVSRLARLAGSDEIRQWLNFELSGYPTKNDAVSIKYMATTGRLIKKGEGYLHSLAGISAHVEAAHSEMKGIRVPDIARTPDTQDLPTSSWGIPDAQDLPTSSWVSLRHFGPLSPSCRPPTTAVARDGLPLP
jgi:hypothetical protein